MMEGIEGHGWGMGLGMVWWWVIGILLVALIIWLIVRASNRNAGRSQSYGKSPLDVLKDRYARGEIDKEEFERKKKDL